ncbi:MAG: hypothetical protein RMK29_05230 [Myxococcales bacterium]|nr:hypothetical protein [Myxococcota bacterium]MDW8281093.1 hypothetical protein [Myxococcales bacterium]
MCLPLRLVAVLLGCLCAPACSRVIGDACTQNVDCSIAGDRFCDIASPDGYCTIEGCDHDTCPDGAVCVRFFTLMRGAPGCDPRTARLLRADCPPNDASCCRPGDGLCCAPGELCLCSDADCRRAYCASETSERRWCMRPCNDHGQCRQGYVCMYTGHSGAELVPRPGQTEAVAPVGFCAPAPQR